MLVYFFLVYSGWDSVNSFEFNFIKVLLWKFHFFMRKFLRSACVSFGDSYSLSLMPKNLVLFFLLKHCCFTTLRSGSSSLTILPDVIFSVAAVTSNVQLQLCWLETLLKFFHFLFDLCDLDLQVLYFGWHRKRTLSGAHYLWAHDTIQWAIKSWNCGGNIAKRFWILCLWCEWK